MMQQARTQDALSKKLPTAGTRENAADAPHRPVGQFHIVRHDVQRGSRRGMMTMVNMVVVLLLTLMLAFLLNVANTIKRKPELQHVADEAAFSATNQKTRMLNAITATNHVIGEGHGMLIAHHALGGDLLDRQRMAERHAEQPQRGQLNQANRDLDQAYQAARNLGARTPQYARVRQKKGVFAEAALLRGKLNLKKLLAGIYWKKVAAKLMQKYPPTRPAGKALEIAMDQFEREVGGEYRVLNQVQAEAKRLLELKLSIRDDILVSAKVYTREIVDHAPTLIQDTASQVAKSVLGANATAFVVDPTLPVVIDPLARASRVPEIPALAEKPQAGCCACGSQRTDVTRDQIVKVTQLARAAVPFLYYHRQPIWDGLLTLTPLSRSGNSYKHNSDKYSKVLSDRYQMDRHDLGLYVLKNYPAPDKGYALWAEDDTPNKARVNMQFGTLVALHVPRAPIIGSPAVFRQPHRFGQIAYAQGMSYNGNREQRHPHRIDLTCKRITPNRQTQVGYDTLNWRTPAWELIAKTDQGGAPSPEFPEIRVNWQAKLTPASAPQIDSLKQSGALPAEMRPVVSLLLDDIPGALLGH